MPPPVAPEVEEEGKPGAVALGGSGGTNTLTLHSSHQGGLSGIGLGGGGAGREGRGPGGGGG